MLRCEGSRLQASELLPRLRLFIAMAALLGGLACQRGAGQVTRIASDSTAAHALASELASDSLTARQRCYLGIFERQQLPGTECMTACIRDGSGVGIGGGCWHNCYAYTGEVMPNPNRFASCPAADPEPVSPKPVVQCTETPGKRELRIRFVDAATGARLHNGMVFPLSSHTGVVLADSLGVASVPVAGQEPTRLFGRVNGYVYAADTLAVGQNMVCDVLMRLASGRGHGF